MPVMAMARSESAKYDTSVSPGEMSVQISVSATYELTR
jgi:uncharacterized protein YggE